MKINVAANFIKRVTSLTTNQTHEQQSNIIFQHLRRNNYPSSLINRMINRATSTTTAVQHHHRHQNYPQQNQNNNNPQTRAPPDEIPTAANQQQHLNFRSIPYIAHLSPTIASLLKTDYPQVKVAYRTLKNTNNILRPVKDPVDVLDQRNVIYSLACIDCQKTYIGMTRNQLKTRISGHRSNINEYTKLSQNNNTNTDEEIRRLGEKTAIMKHIIEESHMFNLTQPKILDRTNKISTLPLLEMCHITYTSNTVNHRTDVQGLSTTYAGLLHTIKKSTTRRRNTNTTELPSDQTLHDHLAHNDNHDPLSMTMTTTL